MPRRAFKVRGRKSSRVFSMPHVKNYLSMKKETIVILNWDVTSLGDPQKGSDTTSFTNSATIPLISNPKIAVEIKLLYQLGVYQILLLSAAEAEQFLLLQNIHRLTLYLTFMTKFQKKYQLEMEVFNLIKLLHQMWAIRMTILLHLL